MTSDEYIEIIFKTIQKKYEDKTIKVLTVSLSPEWCGGWDPAEHLCQKLCNIMNINFALPQT